MKPVHFGNQSIDSYQQLLSSLKRQPVHAARAHPLEQKGYDVLNLEKNHLLPKVETGVKELDEKLDSAGRQITGLFKIAKHSAIDTTKSTGKGALYGAIAAGGLAILRFVPPAIGSGKFLAAGATTAAMAVFGGLIGAIIEGWQSFHKSSNEITDIIQNKLDLAFQ